mgnify:CR=1 FL=1
MMHKYNTQSKSDSLFNAHSRVLQSDQLILENDEKATLHINIDYISQLISVVAWEPG